MPVFAVGADRYFGFGIVFGTRYGRRAGNDAAAAGNSFRIQNVGSFGFGRQFVGSQVYRADFGYRIKMSRGIGKSCAGGQNTAAIGRGNRRLTGVGHAQNFHVSGTGKFGAVFNFGQHFAADAGGRLCTVAADQGTGRGQRIGYGIGFQLPGTDINVSGGNFRAAVDNRLIVQINIGFGN